eukprot:3666757-Prorocentrum_lima.AAC.1
MSVCVSLLCCPQCLSDTLAVSSGLAGVDRGSGKRTSLCWIQGVMAEQDPLTWGKEGLRGPN